MIQERVRLTHHVVVPIAPSALHLAVATPCRVSGHVSREHWVCDSVGGHLLWGPSKPSAGLLVVNLLGGVSWCRGLVRTGFGGFFHGSFNVTLNGALALVRGRAISDHGPTLSSSPEGSFLASSGDTVATAASPSLTGAVGSTAVAWGFSSTVAVDARSASGA